MTSPARHGTDDPIDAAIRELGRRGLQVLDIRRSRYATSHLTYDLTVAPHDGCSRRLVWKSLSDRDLLPEARGRRPSFVADARREPSVYRSILAGAGLGTAELFAEHADPRTGDAWLLLEKVAGRELYQFGDLGPWQQAARWLVALGRCPVPPTERERLVSYDEEWFTRWPDRARASMASATPHDRRRLAEVLDRYAPVVSTLAALPRGLVHGEFYASNILVDVAADRVCAVDWEMAGIGSPLLDLAALVSGGWTDDQRADVALAYLDELPAGERPATDTFLTELDLCRLHLCIQWLGWSTGWVPPTEAATDWLGTAHEIALRLG